MYEWKYAITIESSQISRFTREVFNCSCLFKKKKCLLLSSMMSKVISIVFFQIVLLSLQLRATKSQTWIRVGYYWSAPQEFPVSHIDSTLFTHLICGFANLNSTSYELYLSPGDENYISTFTKIVKQKNPSVTTLLSIAGPGADYSNYSSMVSNSSYRKSLIYSSIKTARRYDFEGLDFYWCNPETASDMSNLAILFEEWRVAINLEARNSSKSQLILTVVLDIPHAYSELYPIDTVQQYINWSHVLTSDYSTPEKTNFTAPPSALYDTTNDNNTDNSVRGWIDAGLPANKLVMCLPYYGYAWKLVNSSNNGIGAPAIGPAGADDGFIAYDEIKNYLQDYESNIMYNSTYVVNYCTVGTDWIGFDYVEAIRAKVSYAKEKRLLGYHVWQVSYDDDNWVLSRAAAQPPAQKENATITLAQAPTQEDNRNKQPYLFLIIILPAAAAVMLLLGFLIYFRWMKKLKSKGSVDSVEESRSQVNNTAAAAAGDFNGNAPNLVLYSLVDIEAATDNFSIENKLGEGGYGPVYKAILQDGQEVAIKKLSKTSAQGFEEFKNEVMLTAKLQHINLVRLLGFCIDKEEHMLVYEYMSNKSLDRYLFDPIKKYKLDWKKRIDIIEGICQGLLYLQEYSRLTIIHRDLKASNILLDKHMKPKISDFGMAKIFTKDGLEENTGRIVGTYGYAPPEYIRQGRYSTKYDVYSFGVLLLQIIGGKRVSILYGENVRLSLLEYAYELWTDGRGEEFMDLSLNDTDSYCKLIRCLHIALLCVQEISIDRPSMLEVSWMLKNETTDLNIPKKPGFSKQTDEIVRHECTTSNLEIGSVNETTISILDAR